MSAEAEAAVRLAVDDLAGRLAAARQALDSGRIVDLSDLDAEARKVCESLTELPAETARGFQPSLLALIDDLEQLSKLIEGDLKVLGDAIGGNSQRRQATSAYGRKPGG